MATLYVGDREVYVAFDSPAKAHLTLYSVGGDYRTFNCTVEHTKGSVTAENLMDAASGLVRDAVAYESTYDQVQAEQQAVVETANRLMGWVEPQPGALWSVDEACEAPRRKFLGIF